MMSCPPLYYHRNLLYMELIIALCQTTFMSMAIRTGNRILYVKMPFSVPFLQEKVFICLLFII